MNRNQVQGSIKKVAGKIQQEVAEVTGSTSQQLKGAAKRAEGSIQKTAGDIEQATDALVKRSTLKP